MRRVEIVKSDPDGGEPDRLFHPYLVNRAIGELIHRTRARAGLAGGASVFRPLWPFETVQRLLQVNANVVQALGIGRKRRKFLGNAHVIHAVLPILPCQDRQNDQSSR